MALRESFFHQDQFIGADSTWFYSTTLTDKKGAPIPNTSLTSLTLTLINLEVDPHTIVNACQQVNILNTGRGLVNASGTLELTSAAGDTAILDSANPFEKRRARLEWVKSGSGDVLWKEIDVMIVRKTSHVP